MNSNRKVHDLIDQYHQGKISRDDFRQHLESDAELRREFELYQEDMTLIRAAGKAALMKKAGEALAQHEQKRLKIFPMKRVLQVAAAFLILAAAWYFFSKTGAQRSGEELFATYFELPAPVNERDGSASNSSQELLWQSAMAAYSNKEFAKAIELLAPAVEQPGFPYAERGKLFLGLSYLMKNDSGQAIAVFENMSTESSYQQDATWYRALALLKMNNVAEARPVLEQIAGDQRHFKNGEAQEILKSL